MTGCSGKLNRELEHFKIGSLTVTRITRRKDFKHRNHPILLFVMLTNATDLGDDLLASNLLRSHGNVRILPDVSYSERNIIRKIISESRKTFSRGRNISVQSVPKNADPTHINSDIRGRKFVNQYLKLKKTIDSTIGEAS